MTDWPSTKSRRVLAALLQIGWTIKREAKGSHRVLSRPGWPDYVFAFHDQDEIGPRMLSRVAKKTGLNVKTAKSILKNLRKRKIIRGNHCKW